MNRSSSSIAFVVLAASALAACGSKPADTAVGAGGAPVATAAGSATASGDYHGVAIYPGLADLGSTDLPAGDGMTLHSGNFRSTDPQEKIVAFYREALTKQFGAVADLPGSGAGGMVRLGSGNDKDKIVTILVRTGDSGEQLVGIQVGSKD